MGLDRDAQRLDDWAVRPIRRKARQLVGRAGFAEDDREDIEQDLTVDLLHRLPKFDPLRASLHTFVARVVEHGAARLIERQQAPMRDWRRCTSSLNDPVSDDEDNDAERGEFIDQDTYARSLGRPAMPQADQALLRIGLERLVASLPPELRDLCARLADGQNVTEISRDTGVSRGTLYGRLRELRMRAEEAGLGD
jgi:RNA polymerase sigma-70 factor (ECF subfamily)